jgi:MFS family permease
MYGGNVGQGMLTGAYTGAAYGAIGAAVGWTVGNIASYYNISNVYVQGLLQIGSGTVAGGIAAELTGGTFAQGAQGGAIGAAASVVANLAAAKFFAANTKTGKEGIKQAQKNLTVTFEEWQEANSVLYAENTTDAGGVKLPTNLKSRVLKTGLGALGYLKAGTSASVGVVMIWGSGYLTGWNPYAMGYFTAAAVPLFYGAGLEAVHSWEFIKETWSEYP